MPIRKKYEAVATIGKYTDRTGEEKKRYTNVGTVFEDEQGRLSLKLDTIPVGPEWSGWVQFFEPREKEQGGQQARQQPRQQAQHNESRSSTQQAQANDEDDIPF